MDLPHKFAHVAETIIGTVILTATSIMTWLLATAPIDQSAQEAEIRALFPALVGALIGSGGMLALNPNTETKVVWLGRGVFGLLGGTATPSIIPLFWDGFVGLFSHPIVQVSSGALASMVIFAVSRSFAERVFSKSKLIAEIAVDQAMRAARVERKEDVRDAMREGMGDVTRKAERVVEQAAQRGREVIETAVAPAAALIETAKEAAAELKKRTPHIADRK